jgi:hypothetical protein
MSSYLRDRFLQYSRGYSDTDNREHSHDVIANLITKLRRRDSATGTNHRSDRADSRETVQVAKTEAPIGKVLHACSVDWRSARGRSDTPDCARIADGAVTEAINGRATIVE